MCTEREKELRRLKGAREGGRGREGEGRRDWK
jgi:hypothetical protein